MSPALDKIFVTRMLTRNLFLHWTLFDSCRAGWTGGRCESHHVGFPRKYFFFHAKLVLSVAVSTRDPQASR